MREHVLLRVFSVKAESGVAIVIDGEAEIKEREGIGGVRVFNFKTNVLVLFIHYAENVLSFLAVSGQDRYVVHKAPV